MAIGYDGYRLYWNCLIAETRHWPDNLRQEANSAILEAAEEQLRVNPRWKRLDDCRTACRRPGHRPAATEPFHHSTALAASGIRKIKNLTTDCAASTANLPGKALRAASNAMSWTLPGMNGAISIPNQGRNSKASKLFRALAGRVARDDQAFEEPFEANCHQYYRYRSPLCLWQNTMRCRQRLPSLAAPSGQLGESGSPPSLTRLLQHLSKPKSTDLARPYAQIAEPQKPPSMAPNWSGGPDSTISSSTLIYRASKKAGLSILFEKSHFRQGLAGCGPGKTYPPFGTFIEA